MHGTFLLVDKPVGFSSFQIVRMLQKQYSKVGHAGTLDPFASGLLILLINEATKEFDNIQKREKEYTGEILLGTVTDTYDITGTVTEPRKAVDENMTLTELNQVAAHFVGEIEQTPPRFSALKHQGQKLYQFSRKNQQVEITPRQVHIKSFCILDFDVPILRFKTVVGKGVYIRSLAHDFGNTLGCGATLLSLRRTRIGEYGVAKAKKLGMLLSPTC
jgi:tRNA pseudouridine55 synthase